MSKQNKVLLNVGCGPRDRQHDIAGFEGWQELRLDIDPAVDPDVIGSMTDMSAIADNSVDAIVSSHNIEHLEAYQVPVALAEFCRVLKKDGYLVITCPDLQSVCARVAKGDLASPLYESPAGPIAALDIIYGLRTAVASGNTYMAHRCGFTVQVLLNTLQACGFTTVAGFARPNAFDLWAVATLSDASEKDIQALMRQHLPVG